MQAPEYKMVECAECCGNGFDLDTYYWGDEYCEEGTEVDCSVCGGTGEVPLEVVG